MKAAGCIVISSATTVDEARWLEANGCDAIIAQGVEAGGHRGMFLTDKLATQVGTFALVPQVVDAVKVPVIAAGAVVTGVFLFTANAFSYYVNTAFRVKLLLILLAGINMVIYGAVLVLIVMFLPRGIAGTGQSVRALWSRTREGKDA